MRLDIVKICSRSPAMLATITQVRQAPSRYSFPMNNDLILYLNGQACLEATRSGGVPGHVRAWLARLDADMDDGIELDDGPVAAPDVQQRGQFVLARLLAALGEGKTDFARSLLFYLATRWPELRAIRVTEDASNWTAELDFT